ncbi:bacterioferritin-associated ferredoxin [Salmonella enterica subsp. enterica]|nr:bacterioferritin-associated ferredoxin [Salmonella enterica subsp. enterica]
MYVCLCNGIAIKIRRAVRQFHPQSFQRLRKFIPVGSNVVSVFAPREMQDELTQMPEFKEIA